MKKTSFFIICLMVVSASVFYACNKQSNNPEVSESSGKGETFKRKSIELNTALTSASTAVTMSIEDIGTMVKITTSSSVPTVDDNYGLYYPTSGISANSAGEITLTPNSIKWWMVPFDDTKTPIEITAIGTAPSYDLDCYCTMLGECAENQPTTCEVINRGNCSLCEKVENSCCTNCKMNVCNYRISGASPWVTEQGVSYRLVNADVIEFNGVVYPEVSSSE